MNKNIIIAVLVGLLIGSNLPRANADVAAISRADLFAAAALIGVLANESTSVSRGTQPGWWGPSNSQLARQYANQMLENK